MVIGEGVSWLARWSLRLALVTLGGFLVGQLIAYLWVIVLPVLLALLITTVLWPPAKWLRDRGVAPTLSAILVVLLGLAVLGGIITLLTASLVGGVPEIAQNAAEGIAQIRQWLAGPPLNLGDSDLDAAIQQGTAQLQQSVGTIASGLLAGLGAVGSGVVTGVLAVVLAFLFVKDGDRFAPWLRSVVGERAGVHITVVLSRIWVTLAGFIRIQAVVSLIDAIFIGIGLAIVGVPLVVPLAVLTFLGGFIPIVGALVAGTLAVLVALVSNGLVPALIVLGIILAVQQIEGNVLQPILQGRGLKLHAAVVLVAVTAGGSLFGIPGAFLAVPVVAAAAVVLRYLSEIIDERTRRALGNQPEPVIASGSRRDDDTAVSEAPAGEGAQKVESNEPASQQPAKEGPSGSSR